MLISSNTRWTYGTTTPRTPTIRSTAISSISTTIASTAEAAPRAPSTSRSPVFRPRQYSACKAATTTSLTALNNTYQRELLAPYIYDHVNEGNAAIYGENTVHWTDWLRTVLGWRGDYYAASVNSMLQPANSGIRRRPSAARNSAW